MIMHYYPYRYSCLTIPLINLVIPVYTTHYYDLPPPLAISIIIVKHSITTRVLTLSPLRNFICTLQHQHSSLLSTQHTITPYFYHSSLLFWIVRHTITTRLITEIHHSLFQSTHYVNHARHFHQHRVQARSLSINSQLIYLVTHSIIHRAFTYIPTSSLMYAQFILSYHLSSFLYVPSKKTTHHHLVIFGWVVIHSITHRVITDLPTSSYLFTQYATYFFFSLITPHTHP